MTGPFSFRIFYYPGRGDINPGPANMLNVCYTWELGDCTLPSFAGGPFVRRMQRGMAETDVPCFMIQCLEGLRRNLLIVSRRFSFYSSEWFDGSKWWVLEDVDRAVVAEFNVRSRYCLERLIETKEIPWHFGRCFGWDPNRPRAECNMQDKLPLEPTCSVESRGHRVQNNRPSDRNYNPESPFESGNRYGTLCSLSFYTWQAGAPLS